MERFVVEPESRVALPRHVKLRHDTVRDRWLLLAPERVLDPDDTALEVVRLLDGKRSVDDVVAELAVKYSAPAEVIRGDVVAMLQDLADKGFLIAAGATAS